MHRALAALLAAFFLLLGVMAHADQDDEDYNDGKWRELDLVLPVAPDLGKLQRFFVSSASDNEFFVDPATLSVGGDGVVRYVLVVLSPQGARNVTYEGIRCETRERRIYASGRQDGAWSKSRNDAWTKIRDVPGNRVHAALFLEYFCPGGVIVRDAHEASDALRQGVHPDNRRW